MHSFRGLVSGSGEALLQFAQVGAAEVRWGLAGRVKGRGEGGGNGSGW